MPKTENLLWFHSFNRGDPHAIAEVLLNGAGPNPSTTTTTYRNEQQLGLPSGVYAYLGRTLESFGDRAIVLLRPALTGTISPFDTGGLVAHIRPICESTASDKQAFLLAYSWSSAELPGLLDMYPGDGRCHEYLAGDPPGVPGPHVPFPDRTTIILDTWSNPANWWQAWTWEGRSQYALQVGEYLRAWTCRPEEYADLLIEIETVISDPDAFEGIDLKYHDGGVSSLIAHYVALQDAQ